MTDKLHFKVNAELKSVIGKDLINNDNIAVLELVKNAYDAGSDIVNIYFNDTKMVSKEKGSITIVDHGSGMDMQDIRDKWLNIAYSDKKIASRKKGRRMAGNKGVGRFSCDRLGKKLDMYTLKRDGECIHLPIEWKAFESSSKDKEINHISIEYEIVSLDIMKSLAESKIFENGTILKISGLQSEWNVDKLVKLRRELEKFINPHQEADLSSFIINIICPEYKKHDFDFPNRKINGVVQNTIFQDLIERTSSIHSNIDRDGDFITTTLYHRGSKLFTLIEKNPYKDILLDIDIHVMYLNQYDKALFTKRMGYQVLEYGSIFLFLHGFRVNPYGERNNDWLGLDVRKQQGYARYLGTREIFGRIEINDEFQNRWRIISNREGLVNNTAFSALTNQQDGFFFKVFKKLEKYVVRGLSWDTLSMNEKELENKFLSKNHIDKERLPYKKDETEKEKDVLSYIHDIITAGGTSHDSIKAFEFDESLVKMLAKRDNDEIANFFNDFQSLIDKSKSPESVIKNINQLKKLLNEEKSILKKYKTERDSAREKAKLLQKKFHAAEERAKDAEHDAKIAKITAVKYQEENLFLKAESNQDVEDVVDMHHQIIAWAESISKGCRRTINKLKSLHIADNNLTKIIIEIDRIEDNNRKILQLAGFATKKNLRLNATIRKADLLIFVDNYLKHIHEFKPSRFIKIHNFVKSDTHHFICNFKPLEITILVDSIINNSRKAKASNIFITTSKCTENILKIIFDDDGMGIDPIIQNPSDIFNRGFTTTDGSGIGLYHSMRTVSEMGGNIEVCTSQYNGFALKLTLKL